MVLVPENKLSELKQRGRKNYTEKTPQTTIVEPVNHENDNDVGEEDKNRTATTSSAKRQEIVDGDSKKGKVVQKKAGMSLHTKMLLVLVGCCVFSIVSIGFLYWHKKRSGGASYKGAAYFNTRRSKRVIQNGFLARSKIDRWDTKNNGGGGIDHGEEYDDDEDSDEGDGSIKVYNDGHKHNLAGFLAPLLRDALQENNKANLNIDSDQFVHGDDDHYRALKKKSEEREANAEGDSNSDKSKDDEEDNEDVEEKELLRRLEEDFGNKEVPLASDLKRRKEKLQKLALRLQHARQPKIKVLDDINATEFYIAVGQSEPVLVKNASQFCTRHNWTLDFIRAKAGNDVVGVETSKSNRFYANEGLKKKQMKVSEFLDQFTNPNREMDYYLAEEGIEKMPLLGEDLNIDNMDFANFAVLDRKQLWVGAGGQVSPLHHDQWDNILCQMQGKRTFVLYDPLQVDRLYPKSGSERHFSQVDASNPDFVKFPKFRYARQYRVDVEAGQMIILPAYWWHQVHHGPDVNVGVNYWFVPASLMSELLYDLMLPDGYNY